MSQCEWLWRMRMTMPQPLGVLISPWRCQRARNPKLLPCCGPLTQMREPMGSCSTESWVRTIPHPLTQHPLAQFYSLLACVILSGFGSPFPSFYVFHFFFHAYICISACLSASPAFHLPLCLCFYLLISFLFLFSPCGLVLLKLWFQNP